ncbi:MAG: hypothetical protein HZA91_15985 [Verrucomicrobia bacterium]|nr:hypothetical protein [Verrucomicrobiota bacterium]
MTQRGFQDILAAAAVAVAFVVPVPTASACAVCFSDPTGPMAQGMNMGILTLLGVTLGVLGGIAWFLASLVRRSAAAARMNSAGILPAIHKEAR